ncbi:DUF1080 domain-containing protein [candidate division KSB1 bacterium]|nr:DUF1080 domain-containing protein [candidate division KSB1 bacterium]
MRYFFIFITVLLIALPAFSQDAGPFLGRWALYLPDNGGAGWLNVTENEGYLDAELLWIGGSVTPVSSVLMNGQTLVVTQSGKRERKKDNNVIRTHYPVNWFEFHLIGKNEMIGKALFPDRRGVNYNLTEFTGKRIPDLPPSPDLDMVKFGKAIKLFNGKDLSGWKLINPENTNGFKVVDGALVNEPVQEEGKPHIHYGNVRTEVVFEDFNLKLQVNVPEGSNSGIYLRGIYEVQVMDSYGREPDSHNMGAIYSRITPSVAAEKPAGEWQDLDITLCDRHVKVILNGKTIIDNQPLLGVTGGALTACEFSPGPIYLQGDHGYVMYRNIVLTPIVK